MKRIAVAVLGIAALVLSSCSNANMPKTTIMGVQVGGGSSYCVMLSSGVGAVGGGVAGGFLAAGQGQQGTGQVGWTTASTFVGAMIGAGLGYLACGPTPAATPASETKVASK